MGLIRGLAELVVPPSCFACSSRSLTPLCHGCATAIEPIEDPVCPVCGRPTVHDVEMCARCRAHRPAFDKARALTVYDFPMREAIIGMKSQQGRGLADFLAPRLNASFSAEFAGADALTYVPVTPGRLHKRGFNQARELAEAAGSLSSRPVVDALRMVRAVKDQGQLSIDKRQANMEDAFAIKGDLQTIRGKRLILIDDVITTGATVSACSAALKNAGAGYVTVITLAQAVTV